ncbi:hypothetical protein KSF_077770 [Reticulibacter mediterranei]|uniref:DUF3592 domain-containing protein n=1 Tax=Reticulibacter mediterranei TaxID=2778369 RepID=A0A8J3ITR8_9CHLR|nr:DUF3592 domain-containing protein [Reticulibacter mediterranei]GHO97729.1 hypothetical protein KSF_077770 [Reticulibacter mediterranei]
MLRIFWSTGFFQGRRFTILSWIGAAFFGFGLLFTLISGILFLTSGFFQLQKYVQGQCTITEKHMESELSTQTDNKGRSSTTTVYRPSFTYQVHAANGRVYTGYNYQYSEMSSSSRGGEQAILDRFQLNGTYPCWYNPASPSEAVLDHSVGVGNWIIVGAFLAFGLFFGVAGVIMMFKGWRPISEEEQFLASVSGSSQSGSVLPSLGSIFEGVSEVLSSGESQIDEATRASSFLQTNNMLWTPPAEEIAPAEREDMMSSNEIVERYMALWNEEDDETRRELIEQLWVEAGVQLLSSREYRGYDELEERVTGAHKQFVKTGGYIFRRAGEVKEHHGAIKLDWEMVPAGGGEVAGTGTVFLLLSEDGRIHTDYQF